jgi:hypothetical protein
MAAALTSIAGVLLATITMLAAPPQPAGTTRRAAAPAAAVKTFDSPQQAAVALIDAADRFDTQALTQLFGPAATDVIFTKEPAQDRARAKEFVAKAREKEHVAIDPKNPSRAILIVGNQDWPFPAPIVKRGATWSFDLAAGRRDILYRRVGANELDAIAICHGYVESQHEYALKKRAGDEVHQYAQRIISTPGTQDGLAWQNRDGTWGGPIGEKVARAIAQGYATGRGEPYHGYFFKILKGQGPAAPLGQLDYVVKGAMIGGFALAAAPSEYGVTGVKTFMVSQDGVVYEKDLGPNTSQAFSRIERFNPDKTWTPVREE